MIEVYNKKKKRIGFIKGNKIFDKKQRLIGYLDGNIVNPAFGEIIIPRNLKKSEFINFSSSVLMNIQPGKYKVFFDLKRELMTWFSEKGNTPCLVEIEIV